MMIIIIIIISIGMSGNENYEALQNAIFYYRYDLTTDIVMEYNE